ncbi:MAG TPA: PIN domain-containing protein [Terriglobales bacterium]|nr:PIN domain-containing protein [Terriglobales bacterium]
MIYLDSSVALAELLAEDRHPSPDFWEREMAASWLTAYEIWNRLHVRRADAVVQDAARYLLDPIHLLELTPEALARALDPFPVRVRTLDGLHLASMDFLRAQGHNIELATYDRRLASAARALDLAVLDL